ncbi:MAG: hypothetical protein WCW66_02895 [Patescibacteria group bacterium]
MKKPILILLIVVLVIIIAGITWFIISKGNNTNTNTVANINLNSPLINNSVLLNTNIPLNTNEKNINLISESTHVFSPDNPPPPRLTQWGNYKYIKDGLKAGYIPSSADEGLDYCAKQAEQQNYCREIVAMGFRDVLLCEKSSSTPDYWEEEQTENTYYKNVGNCIYRFIVWYGPYDCKIHEDSRIQDQCNFKLASGANIPDKDKYCSLIIDRDLRKECKNSINQFFDSENFIENIKLISKSQCYLFYHPDKIDSYTPGSIFRSQIKKLINNVSDTDCKTLGYSEEEALKTLNTDEDGDGFNLAWELLIGLDDSNADMDRDGYNDYQEVNNDFDPYGYGVFPDIKVSDKNELQY